MAQVKWLSIVEYNGFDIAMVMPDMRAEQQAGSGFYWLSRHHAKSFACTGWFYSHLKFPIKALIGKEGVHVKSALRFA